MIQYHPLCTVKPFSSPSASFPVAGDARQCRYLFIYHLSINIIDYMILSSKCSLQITSSAF